MLDSLFSKQTRVRQPSVITGSSVDTMSTMTGAPITTMISKRTNKNKGRHCGDDTGNGDANSHHSQSSAEEESSLVSVKSGISKCCKQGSLGLRRWQMFQMIFLPFIPITALIIQNSTLLSSVAVNLQEAWEMKQQINTIIHIGKLLAELQQERAELGYCLFTNAPEVLIAYKNIIRCIENYSISMIYGLYYFGKGKLSQNSFNKYVQFDSLASDYLNATKSFSPEVTILWDRLIGKSWKEGFMRIMQRRAVIYRNDRDETSANEGDAKIYYANMTNFIEELRKFQRHLRIMVDNQVVDEMIAARAKIAAAALLLIMVMLISPVIICLVRNITKTIQQYSMMLSSKTMDLRREKRKSDRLLQQMLPGEVIRQLRAKKQVPAESFESVTIYFSDIVSFTSISSSSSPMEIVVMLNSLYKMFDSRIENYDVYKVETIGDAYMVVSGLPTRNGITHAGEICTMALDLIAGVRNFEIPHRPGVGLQIRVGINTGCCVAGVVGTRMPRYCLFGDAINVASRMESHGEPMKIHVTDSTKVLLDELGGYITEDRGVLDVKGKGTMNTYWLVDKVGGIPRTLEMTTPGFFTAADDHTPEFMREIFGSSDSQDDVGGDLEAVQLSVGKLPINLPTSRKPRHSHQSSQEPPPTVHHVARNSTTSFFSTRYQGCQQS